MNMPAPRRAVSSAMTEGLGLPQPARISIANGRFTLIDRAGNEMQCNLVDQSIGFYIDVVIIGANPNKSKVYYEGDWSPQSSDPPVCWSDNGVAPSMQSISPQSDTCGACEWNKIGSDVSKRTGNNIKACQDRKKMAVYVVGLPPPLGNEIFQLVATPGALKGLAAYGKYVSTHPSASGQGAADVSEVVTRLYFAPGQVGVIAFGATAGIDAQMNQRIDSAYAANLVDEVTGVNDVPIQGRLAAPAQQQRLAAPQTTAYAQPPQAQLPPPQAQAWGPPPAPTGMPAGQQPQTFVAARPVQPAAVPPPPPQPVWDAAANAWVLPAQPAPAYPAPQPGDDPYAVPAFLQAGQHPTAPQGGNPALHAAPGQIAPATATFPSNPGLAPGAAAAQQNFQPAPQQPAPAPRKGRGGPRTGAGRPKADASTPGAVYGTGTAQPNGSAPGQAFGAAPAQPAQPGFAPQQAGPAPAPSYGMAPAGAPPNDMSAALDRAFSTPIPGR